MSIMKKLYLLLPKQEHFWSFNIFLKKYEAEGNFPNKPSQNILRLFHVIALFPFIKGETEQDIYHQKLDVQVVIRVVSPIAERLRK